MASFWIAGKAASSDDVVAVFSPLDGHEVGRSSNATAEQVR